MVDLRPNYGNSDNWLLIFSDQFFAIPLNPDKNSFIPIPKIKIPVQVSNSTIAIFPTVEYEKKRWIAGGWLSVKIFSGLIAGNVGNAEIQNFFLRLNQINLLRIPTIDSSFSLEIEVPYWFRDYSYILWEYIGEGMGDNEGKLDEIAKNI